MGAGKTQAVRTISDIEVVSTEAGATDETALRKSNTTVAMDMGVMHLGEGDKVRLLGSPGQERFDFMWDILLDQAKGLVVLVDHSRSSAVADLRFYAERLALRGAGRWVPWLVGVTHVDEAANCDMRPYQRMLATMPGPPGMGPVPVLPVDARAPADVRALLLTLTSMLEVTARFPVRGGAGTGATLQ